MSSLGYLFAGMVLAWATVFVYLWYLARRASDLERQLGSLEDRLERD